MNVGCWYGYNNEVAQCKNVFLYRLLSISNRLFFNVLCELKNRKDSE